MKDIEFDINNYWCQNSYHDLIESFEHEVLVEYKEQDYQGDYLFLLRDGDRYGFLTFGFGSCSGCDALQGCDSKDEMIALRDNMYRSIRWEDSANAMVCYLLSKEYETEWYRDEFVPFRAQALAALQGAP
jgi:hypothetical protein